jgi:hypothetical protein
MLGGWPKFSLSSSSQTICFVGQSQSLDFSICKRSFLLGLADLNVAGKIRCFLKNIYYSLTRSFMHSNETYPDTEDQGK